MAMTDAQWAALAPLVEACRPRSKRPPRDLRRTLDGILWRHRNGAIWRAVPAEYGPWWRSAQLFIRWSRLGAWQRLLGWRRYAASSSAWCCSTGRRSARTPRRRVPAKGASSQESQRREALGRSRGGFRTKACLVADARGRAVAFAVAPGEAHELPLAPGLLGRLPRVPLWVVGDRGYRARAFASRSGPWAPSRDPDPRQRGGGCPAWIYVNRNRVERLWARLKEWRAVATMVRRVAAGACDGAAADRVRSGAGRLVALPGPMVASPLAGSIEIAMAGGVRIRIEGAVDPAAVTAAVAAVRGAPAAVIPLPSDTRGWLATGHTDMRRGMNGLALQVQEVLRRDPYGGHVFIFRPKRGDRPT